MNSNDTGVSTQTAGAPKTPSAPTSNAGQMPPVPNFNTPTNPLVGGVETSGNNGSR